MRVSTRKKRSFLRFAVRSTYILSAKAQSIVTASLLAERKNITSAIDFPSINVVVLGRKKGRWKRRFFKHKHPNSSKGSKRYICGQKGHFVKQFPKAGTRGQTMFAQTELLTHCSLDNDDLESLFFLQDYKDEDIVFSLPVYSSGTEESFDSDAEVYFVQLTPSIPVLSVLSSAPHIPIQILWQKHDKPFKVNAFVDTAAAESMIALDHVPPNILKPYV